MKNSIESPSGGEFHEDAKRGLEASTPDAPGSGEEKPKIVLNRDGTVRETIFPESWGEEEKAQYWEKVAQRERGDTAQTPGNEEEASAPTLDEGPVEGQPHEVFYAKDGSRQILTAEQEGVLKQAEELMKRGEEGVKQADELLRHNRIYVPPGSPMGEAFAKEEERVRRGEEAAERIRARGAFQRPNTPPMNQGVRNPTNIPGQGPPKGTKAGSQNPSQSSNPEKEAKRERKLRQRKGKGGRKQ